MLVESAAGGAAGRRSVGGCVLLVVATLWLWAMPARAQLVIHGKRVVSVRALPPALVPAPGEICIYRATGRTAGTFVRAHPPLGAPALRAHPKSTRFAARQEASAAIAIDYDSDFPEAAREALRRAADIWERHIRSPVEIRINAAWVDTLGKETLASAGTTLLIAFRFDGGERIVYPMALADALLREDYAEAENDDGSNDVPDDIADMVMYVNAKRDDWYFGAGEPSSNEISFTTVALHEITHGLGFYGSMSVEDGVGSWGFNFDGIDQPVPAVYDVSRVSDGKEEGAIISATEDKQGRRLTNTSVYPNPSEKLANALEGRVFFDGPQASAGSATDADAPDPRSELFAPDQWQQGSSYSHLDEGTYPAGDLNSLMTPFIGAQEVIQSPGGIVCGIFADMGWPLGTGCQVLLSDLIAFAPAPVPEENAVNVQWVLAADSEVERVLIQRCDGGKEQCGAGDYREIASVGVSDGSACQRGPDGKISCQYRVSIEKPGLYTFRLVLVEADGAHPSGLEREAFLAPRQLLVQIYPNPFREQATLRIVFADERPRRLIVDLYDTIGRLVRRRVFTEVRREERIEIDPDQSGLAAGVYFVRVRGDDFSETRQIVVVR